VSLCPAGVRGKVWEGTNNDHWFSVDAQQQQLQISHYATQ